MLKWIFSTQSNVIVVGVAYAYSVFFVGDTVVTQDPDVVVHQKPSVIVAFSTVMPMMIGEELERSIRFQLLVTQWRIERGASSSIEEMCTQPAYLSILALGPPALPLLFQQLRSEGDDPDHWFVALHHITKGADPVPAQDKGNMVKMSQAWLRWAEQEAHNAG
jgi:hypothetical protein